MNGGWYPMRSLPAVGKRITSGTTCASSLRRRKCSAGSAGSSNSGDAMRGRIVRLKPYTRSATISRTSSPASRFPSVSCTMLSGAVDADDRGTRRGAARGMDSHRTNMDQAQKDRLHLALEDDLNMILLRMDVGPWATEADACQVLECSCFGQGAVEGDRTAWVPDGVVQQGPVDLHAPGACRTVGYALELALGIEHHARVHHQPGNRQKDQRHHHRYPDDHLRPRAVRHGANPL